jgi:tRNA U38,U39,U40 pseudouridine synthase TruA
MDTLFTINLTRGAYVVRQPDAERMLQAISARESHALVKADILGDGLYYSPVRIVVDHVISIVENEHVVNQSDPQRRLSIVGV